MPVRYVDNAAGNHGDNSPAIHRWGSQEKEDKVPAGTGEALLPSLAGLCPFHSANPAMNRWAIVKGALSSNRTGMVQSLHIRLPDKKEIRKAGRQERSIPSLLSCLPAFLIEFFLGLSGNRISMVQSAAMSRVRGGTRHQPMAASRVPWRRGRERRARAKGPAQASPGQVRVRRGRRPGDCI